MFVDLDTEWGIYGGRPTPLAVTTSTSKTSQIISIVNTSHSEI